MRDPKNPGAELAATMPGGSAEEETPRGARPTSAPAPATSKARPRPKPVHQVVSPGTTIGRYLILNRLGEGGMGVVYAAFDTELTRKIAIKLLHPENTGEGTEGRARLLREAQVLAQLAHPNVVTIYDVGTYHEQVFIAMEFIEGGTLTDWLAAQKRSYHEILEMFLQAGRGLSAAHAANFVHRDFKPDNVLIGKDQRIRVTDFGVARLATAEQPPMEKPDLSGMVMPVSGSGLNTPLTTANALIGTPRYMAPEQFEAKTTDARTDQFSYCVALYQALYQQDPFPGDTLSALFKSVSSGVPQQPPPSTQVPLWIHKLLLRGLSPDPDARFPSMDELLRALAPKPKATLQHRVITISAVVTALSLSSLGLYYVLRTPADPCAPKNQQAKTKHAAAITVAKKLGEPGWPANARTLQQHLVAYADSWLKKSKEVCLATQQQKQSPNTEYLRTHCLHRLYLDLEAVGRLAQKDAPESVDSALKSIWSLSPVSLCDDQKMLTAPAPLPTDKVALEKLDRLEKELAAIWVIDTERAKKKDLLARAIKLESDAKELGYAPLHAESLLLLGNLQKSEQNLRPAEDALTQAAVVGLRSGHLHIASEAFSVLAVLTARNRKLELAETHYRLAEATLVAGEAGQDIGVAELQGRARLRFALGEISIAKRNYQGALDYHKEALALRQKSQTSEGGRAGADPELAASYNSIARVQRRLHKEDEAIKADKQAIDIYTVAYGPTHSETGAAVRGLAMSLAAKGDYAAALAILTKYHDTNVKIQGAEHPSNAEYLRAIAGNEIKLGRRDEAAAHLAKALKVAVRDRDKESILRDEGRLHMQNGDYATAIAKLQESMSKPDPQRTLRSKLLLAQALTCAGQVTEAEQLALQVLSTSQDEALRMQGQHPTSSYEKDSTDIARARQSLGFIFEQQGKYEEALPHLNAARESSERTEDLFETAASLIGISRVHAALAQLEKADETRKAAEKLVPQILQLPQQRKIQADARAAKAMRLMAGKPRRADKQTAAALLAEATAIYGSDPTYDRCALDLLTRWMKKNRIQPASR